MDTLSWSKIGWSSMKPYLKKSVPFPGNPVSEYFSNGLWTSQKFLPGMYFRIEDHPDREKVSKNGKKGPQKELISAD